MDPVRWKSLKEQPAFFERLAQGFPEPPLQQMVGACGEPERLRRT